MNQDTQDPRIDTPAVEPIPEPEGDTEIIATDYDIGQDNFSGSVALELDIHKVVFTVSAIGIMLVVVFFITSSDSGSLVIDTIAAGGKTNAPVIQRVFWASFEGAVAIALLLGGGLAALQAMAVSTGLPFTFVLLAACYAVVRGLMNEPR